MKKGIKLNEALTISAIGISSMMIYSQADLLQEKLIIKKELEDTEEKVLEVTLNIGENLPDLNANGEGYTKVIVKTIGDKKLDATDFAKLKESNISYIDLSNSKADSIPAETFKEALRLETFLFPNGITSIGADAFNGCTNLRGELNIPNTVTTLGDRVFKNCISLTGDLIIPDSVTEIKRWAFEGCAGFNGTLKLSENMRTINVNTFNGCSGLTGELIIPESVTAIWDNAFNSCVGFTGNLIIPNSVERIGTNAFSNCTGFTGDLIIPDSVIAMGAGVFSGCTGFDGKLIFGKGLKDVSPFTFDGCKNLTGDLIIPDTITRINAAAFSNCSGFNGELVLPKNVTHIGQSAFNNCSGLIGKLILPKSLTTIEQRAFQKCSGFTGDLIIPDSVTSLGSNTFIGCSGFNGRLNLSKNLSVVSYGTFEGCSGLSGKLEIPTAIETIEGRAFYGCSGFTDRLIIPSSIKKIYEYAFNNVRNVIGDVVLGKNIEHIGVGALSGLTNVDNILIATGEEYIDSNYRKSIIDNLDKNKTIIELSYNFDETGTWLETTNFKKSKPTPIKVTDGIEDEYDGEAAQSVVLNIPFLDENAKISALKDGKEYRVSKSVDGKYIFDKSGNYEVNIETSLGTISNINFIVDEYIIDYENAENTANEASKNPTVDNLTISRDLTNKLPEGEKKEELQELINNIFPNISIEPKTISANLDMYIKSENMLSMSIDTNSVTFEDYSGVEDAEILGAVNLSINSSLPYQLNAYMPVEIANSNKSETLPIDILNIKESSETNYQTFENTIDKIILKDGCIKGNDKLHTIDLKLASNLAHKADIYKTVIKFEAEQK